MSSLIDKIQPGRAIVVAGAVVYALAALFLLIHRGDDAYTALTKSFAPALLLMTSIGVGQRFWHGDKLQDASLAPDGTATVGFEETIATATGQINARVDELTKDVNSRLRRLETQKDESGQTSS